MDDRVGDILAQRAKLENGAAAAVFFSVVFHGALSALAGWSAWHHTAAQSQAPVMMIRLAQPPPQPVAEIAPAPPPMPVPVATPQPPPPVAQPIEKPKPSKKNAPPSPF